MNIKRFITALLCQTVLLTSLAFIPTTTVQAATIESVAINPNGGVATQIDGSSITSSVSRSLGNLIAIGETKSFDTSTQTIDFTGTYSFDVQGGKGGNATMTGVGTAYGGNGTRIVSKPITINNGTVMTFTKGADSHDITKPALAQFTSVTGDHQFGGAGTDTWNGTSIIDWYQSVFGDGGNCSSVTFANHAIYAAGGGAGTVYQFAYAKLPTTYQGSGVLNGINTYMDDTDHTWECNSIDFDKNWCAMYGGSFSGGSGLWTNQYGRGAGGGYKNGSYGGAGSNACASGSPG